MRAEIVSVGTELLLGQIVDTNAPMMGQMLAELGVQHTHRQTVGDNLERLVDALRLALSRSDMVITIGGLGPTMDDITRDGVAGALGVELVTNDRLQIHLQEIFASRRLSWVESQNRQAMVPTCGEPIDNPHGTAPGLVCRKDGKLVFCLPGPKNEFVPMARGPVREEILRLAGTRVFHSRVVRVCGIGEAKVEDLLKDMMSSENPTVAPYAKLAEVHLRVTSSAESIHAAEAKIAPVVSEIQNRLGWHAYGFDEDSLEKVVLDRMRGKYSLAVAESCSGGGLGARITGVPGSSDVFAGGWITYSNEFKTQELGVDRAVLETHGAVSEECARAMAERARSQSGADFALSITGIAGPGGGSEDKPVGLVYIGLAGPTGTTVEEHRFRGGRDAVQGRSVQNALVLLLRTLVKGDQ
ncbi:MAG: competence/damage-inducible protein A [Armatimonadetes bacterium]|nr:competence/damage-inducible protein A [Armatimonadota bacterium]